MLNLLLASFVGLIIPIAIFLIWRKKAGFIWALNFRRPFWLALSISTEMIALGFLGSKLTPIIFHVFHIRYEKLGSQDLISLAFGVLVFVGAACLIYCCLWYLIAAILSSVRAKQNFKK